MRTIRTIDALLVIALMTLGCSAQAHFVAWKGNPNGARPNEPLVLAADFSAEYIFVQPVTGETCTVVVNLNPATSTLISAEVISSPETYVQIEVVAQRIPHGNDESAIVSGEWHATGLPENEDCGAVDPHPFSVNVVVGGPSMAQTPNAIAIGDPVSTATGEVTAASTDLFLGGPLPLRFARSYGSQKGPGGIASALGSNWMHNFDASLLLVAEGATVTLYPGTRAQFLRSGGRWELTAPEGSNYQLIASGADYEFVHPAAGLIYTFSGNGRLSRIQDRNGNALVVMQGAAGPVAVTDGLGRTLTFTYTANRLTAVTDQSGRSVTFSHSGSDLIASTDANGKTTNYSYAPGARASLLASERRPAGNTPWTQQFDAGGRVTAQTDSLGNTTTIAFDQPVPGARIVTDPLGAVTAHLYDGPANLSQLTDAMGNNRLFDYDASFRMTRVTDPLGNPSALSYEPVLGYLASATDAEGNATTYTYTAETQGPYTFHNLSGVRYADGTSIAAAYDGRGNVTSVTDRAGKVSSATYNARGQLLSATNAALGVTSLAYGSDGTVASVTDPSGATTSFAYDERRRPVRASFADGTSRAVAYDAVGRVLTATDERGNATRFVYDDNGNLRTATDALGRAGSFDYDTDDLVTAITDASGNAARFRYDARGSLVSATNAAGETLSLTYDALSRLTRVADASGNGPSLAYDAKGNLVSVTDASGNIGSFTTDRLGRRIAATSPKGQTFTRTYDALGRIAAMTDPLARTTSLTYEARGLLASVSAPGNVAASYGYDDLGLLRQVTDPNGGAWTRAHDAAGRLLARTDPLGRSVSYAYDVRGRNRTVAFPEGTLQISRDAAGNVTRRQYSDGVDLTTTFDASNRLTGGAGLALGYDANGRLAASNRLAVTRDAVGRIATIGYGPGKTVAYTYDARGLPAGVSDWAGGSVSFMYDAAARPVRIDRANGVTTLIRYDENRAVIGIDEVIGDVSLASTALERDALGRVTSATRNTPQEPLLAPSARAQSFDAAAQLAEGAYDGMGRITRDAGRTYAWDLASRLTGYVAAAESASFTYDTLGLRTSRTLADGSSESYVLNYALALPSIAIVTSADADLRYYVHLPDGSLLYSIDAASGARRYYHFDEAGSTVLLTDDAGSVTDSYGITPYGETVTANGGTPNPFTWLGRWGVMQEGASGLYYMRLRYYDSVSARFLSPDPIRQFDPRAINPYQYASGNPLSRIDPTGAKGQDTGLGGGGLGGGGGFLMLATIDFGPGSPLGANAADFYLTPNALSSAPIAVAANLFAQAAGIVQDVEQLNDAIYAGNAAYAGNRVAWIAETSDDVFRYGCPIVLERYNAALRAGSTLFYEEWAIADAIQLENKIQQDIVAANAARSATAAASASRLRTFGTGLIIVGGVIQTGAALVEDINNGADIVVTTTDVGATAVSVGALAAAPPLALVDLGTGGAVSGGIHNALMTPNVVGRVVLGDRFNSGDQAAVKACYTRFAVGRWAWNAGDYYADWIFGP